MQGARRSISPYIWALIAVTICAVLKVILEPIIGASSPYLVFIIGVIVVAYNFGFWPGVFAVMGSTAIGMFLFANHAPRPVEQPEWIRALVFALQSLIICYICGVRVKAALDRSAALDAEREARFDLLNTSLELQRSELRYRSAIAAIPQIVFVADSEFKFDWINDRWAGITGLEEGQATGMGWLSAVEPSDHAEVLDAISKAIAAVQVLNIELRLRDEVTNAYRWHLVRAVPVRDQERDISQWIGSFTDVHDSKLVLKGMQELNVELENRVGARTRELSLLNNDLEAANRELEAFCYAVSHDLRTPLRGIDGFSKALLEDYGDVLPAEGKDYLERVRSGARRMDELITSLLKLSRISRQELLLQPVNLSELAEMSFAESGAEDDGRAIAFTAEPGLVAEGDAKLIRIVLDNLIGNAIKFTAKSANATVEFGKADTSRGQALFVRDNGVGFNAEYSGKLFVPFERLHSARDYPGSGIGLATVMRCVRKHGGDAWAESSEGAGATIFFTLGPNDGPTRLHQPAAAAVHSA